MRVFQDSGSRHRSDRIGYFQSLKSFTKRNDLEIRCGGNFLKVDKSGQYVNAVESLPKTCES